MGTYTWDIKDYHKCWSGSLAKRRHCLGPTSVINCTPLSALSFWVSLFPGEHGYNIFTNAKVSSLDRKQSKALRTQIQNNKVNDNGIILINSYLKYKCVEFPNHMTKTGWIDRKTRPLYMLFTTSNQGTHTYGKWRAGKRYFMQLETKRKRE